MALAVLTGKGVTHHLGLAAGGLVIGGLGLLLRRRWGFKAYLVAMGMLLYTVTQSPGYYAKAGDFIFVGMFTILFLVAGPNHDPGN